MRCRVIKYIPLSHAAWCMHACIHVAIVGIVCGYFMTALLEGLIVRYNIRAHAIA